MVPDTLLTHGPKWQLPKSRWLDQQRPGPDLSRVGADIVMLLAPSMLRPIGYLINWGKPGLS